MKLFFISLIVFICFFTIHSFPQKIPNKDVIFLIDLSKSMNRNNLFEDVKFSIKDALKQTLDDGDNIYVYSFGEKVYIVSERKSPIYTGNKLVFPKCSGI